MGFLAATLVSCAALASSASIPRPHAKRQVSQLRDDYDFVVVGGGTSGLTVADRLTEAFPAKNVLVIEYGDVHYAPGTFDPPTDWITPQPDAPPSWSFNSLPNPDMANTTAFVLAGQVVGGSSAVNGMFFDRASRHDYDAWTAVGGSGFEQSSHKWDWEGLFPFFQKSVTFTEPPADIVQKYHYTWDLSAYGNGSTPIYSSYPVFQWADQPLLNQAWQEMGINPVTECAGGDKEGVCWVPASQHPVTARRSHAGLGHYADVLPRANYDLLVQHQVVRVVFPNGPSHGPPLVEARSLADDHLFNVTVKGEVIISAGALHTPTVLQRSGIGPASFLDDAGIPVTLDLPGVGANLQDHCGPPVTWNYTEPYTGFFPLPSEMVNNATFKADAMAGFDEVPARGPYTLAGGNNAIFVSLPHLTADCGAITAKIRAMVADGTAGSYLAADVRTIPAMVAGYEAQLLVLADLLDNPEAPSLETPWATSEAPQASSVLAFLLHPLSRGSVRLNLSDPLAQPVLDYRSGSNPVDIDLHLAHVRFLRGLLDTPTMRGRGALETAPGSAVADSDEALEEYVRSHSTLSFMHPCCTAAMLPEDRGGVVGPDLKVHGAEGLRVVDMSVMPLLPGAHLSATAYAVGEKAADIIIQEWMDKEQ
ncbi:GMC oxidoreductase-like protein [Thermothelomyces heterothallicus CBS 202.75]|uniref:GMC oxidoreductase-like protein n=1 Tax=Thermothelomyces heterothallicus CBS 202.75 TaxID=1149848 RepID=UPI003743C379